MISIRKDISYYILKRIEVKECDQQLFSSFERSLIIPSSNHWFIDGINVVYYHEKEDITINEINNNFYTFSVTNEIINRRFWKKRLKTGHFVRVEKLIPII